MVLYIATAQINTIALDQMSAQQLRDRTAFL